MIWAGLMIARGWLAKVPVAVWVALAALVLWLWERDRHGDARYEEGRVEVQALWDAENILEEEERLKEEQRLSAAAQETDRNVEQARADNRDSTERFIASGGVRQRRCPGQRAQDNSAGNGSTVREAPELDEEESVPTVSVRAQDVRICTDNTLLAEEFRAFILNAENKSQ